MARKGGQGQKQPGTVTVTGRNGAGALRSASTSGNTRTGRRRKQRRTGNISTRYSHETNENQLHRHKRLSVTMEYVSDAGKGGNCEGTGRRTRGQAWELG